jgi:hypothetical protein
MKTKHFFKIVLPILAAVTLTAFKCGGENAPVNKPIEIIRELPKMYMEGNLVAGEHAIIQNQTELLEIFTQETIESSPDLQEIDFSTQTLLIGRDDYNYAAVFNYEFSLIGENKYLFKVDISGGYTVMDYGFWYGIIVHKLTDNAEVIFNINKQNN